MTYTLAQ